MTTPKRIRLRASQSGPDYVGGKTISKPITVSVQHGYLWIGGDKGPCLVYITGQKTLHKIAAMLKAHAR